MPVFDYKAYDSAGQISSGEIESENISAARLSLKKDGLIVSSIKVQKNALSLGGLFGKGGVSLDDLEFFTSELSILLTSGVKIDKALQIISRGQSHGNLNPVLAEINKSLKAGKSVVDAFNTKSGVFDPLYLSLIEIGENSGELPAVLNGISDDLKFKKAVKARIIQAITYPAVILVVCVFCLLFVLNYIVPQMGSIFDDGDEIPTYTQLLLSASEWMQQYQLYALAALLLLFAVVFHYRNTDGMRRYISTYSLKVPLFASVIKQIERIRFSSSLALMLGAGIKISSGLTLAVKSVSNLTIKAQLEKASEQMKKGSNVSSSLGSTELFNEFYRSLLEVGEESGNLTNIFSEIAQRTKSDFESWIDRVTSVLEPLLILVMGAIVGSVVITMLLSVVSVNDVPL